MSKRKNDRREAINDDDDDDWVEIDYPETDELEADEAPAPRQPAPLIRYADDEIVVVEKPASIPIYPGAHGELSLPGLIDLPAEMALVGIAEDEASGLVIFASPAGRQALQAQIADGRMTQRYQAIVRVAMPQRTGTIDQPLLVPRQPWGHVRVDLDRGIPALTDWRLIEAYAGHALLECIPRTVHRNQIRSHLQAAGMPLAVDPTYGGGTELRLSAFKSGYRPSRRHAEKPLIARLTLHAESVELIHPADGRTLSLRAEPPRDFRAAVHQLAKYGRLTGGAESS